MKNPFNSEYIYGFCKKGKIYKSTSKGYYPLQKIKSDFYYISYCTFSNNDYALAFLAFGLIGGAIAIAASQSESDKCVYKINHLKGNSIPISVAPPDGVIKIK